MRGDEGIDDAEQLLRGLGRHAFDLLDAALQLRAGAGQIAGLANAPQFIDVVTHRARRGAEVGVEAFATTHA